MHCKMHFEMNFNLKCISRLIWKCRWISNAFQDSFEMHFNPKCISKYILNGFGSQMHFENHSKCISISNAFQNEFYNLLDPKCIAKCILKCI